MSTQIKQFIAHSIDRDTCCSSKNICGKGEMVEPRMDTNEHGFKQ
jgi:hypothetical protein